MGGASSRAKGMPGAERETEQSGGVRRIQRPAQMPGIFSMPLSSAASRMLNVESIFTLKTS